MREIKRLSKRETSDNRNINNFLYYSNYSTYQTLPWQSAKLSTYIPIWTNSFDLTSRRLTYQLKELVGRSFLEKKYTTSSSKKDGSDPKLVGVSLCNSLGAATRALTRRRRTTWDCFSCCKKETRTSHIPRDKGTIHLLYCSKLNCFTVFLLLQPTIMVSYKSDVQLLAEFHFGVADVLNLSVSEAVKFSGELCEEIKRVIIYRTNYLGQEIKLKLITIFEDLYKWNSGRMRLATLRSKLEKNGVQLREFSTPSITFYDVSILARMDKH